jgi:integrase
MTISDTGATSVRPAAGLELSEKSIKAAAPGDVLRDAKIRGLHLRCFPGRKSFYLYFRTKAGVERKPKLGDWGSITLAQAREAAQEMLGKVALGQDPSAQRSADRGEMTLGDLWKIFKVRHVANKKTARDIEQTYERLLEPRWGNRRLSDIHYEDVCDMMTAIGGTRKEPRRPIMANRTRVHLNTMYVFAINKLRWEGRNPCTGVDMFPENKRRRYLTPDEAKRLGAALDANVARCPGSVAFIYLLIYTGARRGEIAAARWDWLDGQALRLPDSKTGQRTVYLPKQAMDVLAKLPRTNGPITGVIDPQNTWRRIRAEAGITNLTMHDLRHSFASSAIGAGYTLAQIGELLGHATPNTTKRYAHLMEEAAHEAAAKTGELIAQRMGV